MKSTSSSTECTIVPNAAPAGSIDSEPATTGSSPMEPVADTTTGGSCSSWWSSSAAPASPTLRSYGSSCAAARLVIAVKDQRWADRSSSRSRRATLSSGPVVSTVGSTHGSSSTASSVTSDARTVPPEASTIGASPVSRSPSSGSVTLAAP